MSVLDLSNKPLRISKDFLTWAIEECEAVTGGTPEAIRLTGDQCRFLARDVGMDLRLVELSPVLGNVVAFRGVPVERAVAGEWRVAK